MSHDSKLLMSKVQKKTAVVGVVGLGYVGLPLAVLIAKKGYIVHGMGRSESKIKILASNEVNPIDRNIDSDLKHEIKSGRLKMNIVSGDILQLCDIILICVPTPVSHNKQPDLSDLKSVEKTLNGIDCTGKLIINESTVAPFTTRDVFGKLKGNYFLATSPERIDPGNTQFSTENIPKVIGGRDAESTKIGKRFYESFLASQVIGFNSLETAEMSKILENTYRAVNIALVNEFAVLAEKCNINFMDVLQAAGSKWSFQKHYPGIGVGGHCIPVDPYYLLQLADNKKVKMNVVKESLRMNESMPLHLGKKILKVYKPGASVLIYGISYKKNVNDLRESPVLELCRYLTSKKIKFSVYDPFFSVEQIKKLGFNSGSLKEYDILVVGSDHDSLKNDAKKIIGTSTTVIDGKNHFNTKAGKAVYGVGRFIL